MKPAMRPPISGARLFLALVWIASLAGCNRGPQFVEVSGTVTLNGRPLSDLEVVFMPDPAAGTSGPVSSAYTNENGQFRLVTNKGQLGAVVGTHRVCIRDLAAFQDGQNLILSGQIANLLSQLRDRT